MRRKYESQITEIRPPNLNPSAPSTAAPVCSVPVRAYLERNASRRHYEHGPLAKRSRFEFWILVICACCGFPISCFELPCLGAFRAAVAVRDVTPEKLLPVSGGVGASQPVTRKIGPLTVRALVLENYNTRIAICSTDFLGFPAVLGNKVRARVPGIPPQNILIGATHCHSAPDCYGFPGRTGKTDADLAYLDSVCARLAEAINEAADHLQPAKLKIATGKAQGKIAYNYYAEKLYDPRCHVIQILGPAGGCWPRLSTTPVIRRLSGRARESCARISLGRSMTASRSKRRAQAFS